MKTLMIIYTGLTRKMGANGSAKRIMQEVDKLKIRKTKYVDNLNSKDQY